MSEVQKADPVFRRKAIVLIVVALVVEAALIALVPPAIERLARTDRARLPAVIAVAGIVLLAPLAGFAAWFWRLGTRVVSEGRYPPAGVSVIHDTVVLEGQAARLRGRVLRIMAMLLAAALAGMLILGWRLLRLLSA
jgi:hypothetical protein